jgi:MoxR-like ATPase
LVSAAETLAELVERIPDEVPAILKMNMSDPGRFADLAATNMNFRISDKDEVIQRLDIGERIRFVLTRLEREVGRARVMEDVKRQTEVKIEQHQREFYLRQQLKAILAELGETDPGEKEANDLMRKIEEANLPEKVAQEAKRETERMRMLSPAASEYQVIRTYLDWIIALPWNKRSGSEAIELAKVQEALDVRHYGLGEAKERILEYLAVRKLRGGVTHGPILCFVGPPGTGKTSLGEAIATSIGREFYRISVGGVRDEAEIRGHRRTYVGAMPGLLLSALKRVGVKDPVLLIDEVDRADEEFEAFLLELLSDFAVTIPEIGTIRATRPPRVILTSNRTREVHDALKRRCLYHWIDYPTPERELAILQARLPDVPEALGREIVGFVQRLRSADLTKAPGIAETLDWAAALTALGTERLEPAQVEQTLGVLLKYQEDVATMRGGGARTILEEARADR